ncbi:MAG TPA: hypothetical protein VKV80_01765 [Streptosporangiaceae bacterium]|nr:hypothetical protein [Streptosporangiaceae bacterium]
MSGRVGQRQVPPADIVPGAGAVPEILAADREISAGEYHTLDELRAALEERQRQEDADA